MKNRTTGQFSFLMIFAGAVESDVSNLRRYGGPGNDQLTSIRNLFGLARHLFEFSWHVYANPTDAFAAERFGSDGFNCSRALRKRSLNCGSLWQFAFLCTGFANAGSVLRSISSPTGFCGEFNGEIKVFAKRCHKSSIFLQYRSKLKKFRRFKHVRVNFSYLSWRICQDISTSLLQSNRSLTRSRLPSNGRHTHSSFHMNFQTSSIMLRRNINSFFYPQYFLSVLPTKKRKLQSINYKIVDCK